MRVPAHPFYPDGGYGPGDPMRQARRLLTLAILLLLALIAARPVAGQNLMEIFDVDAPYEKTLPAGGEVTYEWLVYNRDPSDLVITTHVEPASGDEWEAQVEPAYAILGAGEGLTVTLRLSATEALDEGMATLSVDVEATSAEDPLLRETEARTAVVNLLPAVTGLPRDNKILNFLDNPLPPPLNGRLATFLISLAIWVILALVTLLVVTPLLRRYAGRTRSGVDDVVLSIVRGPLVLLLIAYGAVQSAAILDPSPAVVNLLFRGYGIVLVLALTWLAYRIFRGILIASGKRWAKKRDTPLFDVIWPVANRAGAILIVVAGASALAGLFGLDLTAFIAGMGVLGIAIAFAAQESLSNFFSGMFLMLDRPFKEGDLVEINGDRCRIERIGLRSTTLYHRPSHKLLVIPNNKMAREMIVNMAEPDAAIRQSTTVGVAYGSDIERVKEVIASAARDHPGVIGDEPGREPYARLEEFGDSALIFKMKFWVKDADQLNRVRGEVNESIARRLQEAGIEIPFPTRTLRFTESLRDLT